MRVGDSALREFLTGTGTDDRGRRHADICRADDAWLERTHDFIQWIFPLDTPSGANPRAPVLTAGRASELARDPAILANLRAAFARMAGFYGFHARGARLEAAGNHAARLGDWAARRTHNDLRITRILRSLMLFGLKDEAAELFRVTSEALASERGGDPQTQWHWRNALR